MRIKILLLSAIVLCAMTAMQAQNNNPKTNMTKQSTNCVRAMNDFAFHLFRNICPKEGSNQNFVYSPMSAYLLLGMLANGADGATLHELTTLTGVPLDTLNMHCQQLMHEFNDMQTPCLQTASYLAVNKHITLLHNYKALTAQHFFAEAATINFAKKESLNKINNWCKKMTRGLIPVILNELTPDMLAVLMNAVYFKGEWITTFDENLTKERNFTCENGMTKKLKQMLKRNNNTKFLFAENDSCQMLRLPYKGNNDFHMTILLPREGNTTSEMMKTMTADKWQAMKRAMRWEIVYITMPVFSIENRIKLKEPMKALGMKTSFSGSANFSKMANTPLKIDDMFQKARIEVNETGTEAAAVTAAVMVRGAAINAPKPVIYHFTADHPFLYTIEDGKNGNIVFMGEFRGE